MDVKAAALPCSATLFTRRHFCGRFFVADHVPADDKSEFRFLAGPANRGGDHARGMGSITNMIQWPLAGPCKSIAVGINRLSMCHDAFAV